VRAPLILQGQGDRNYGATNVVSDHDGSIKAENLPLYDVAQIRGNVEIALLQFPGNYAETHDGDGVTVHAMPAPPAGFRNISGDLKIAITRGDLSISEVEGAVDISNDFGNTSWRVNKPLAARAHRVVSQSGEIEIRVAPQALDALPASFLTECGTIRVAAAIRGDINPVGTSFNGPFGSGPTRGWHGLSHAPKKNDAPNAAGAVGLIERVQQVLGEKERSAGLDVISHGGTIVVQ
jgi:hypothetical protein